MPVKRKVALHVKQHVQLNRIIINKYFHYFIGLGLLIIPLVFFPTLVHSFVHGKELTFKIVVLMLCLGLSIWLFLGKSIDIKRLWNSWIFRLLMAMLAVFLLVTVFAEAGMRSFWGSYVRGFGFVMMLFLAVWYLFSANFMDRKYFRKALVVSYFGGILIAIYAILQKVGIEWFFESYTTDIFVNRSFSFLGNPSYLGQFLVLQFIVGIFLWTTANRRLKQFFIGKFNIIILFGIIFSESRAALLALVIAILLMIIKYWKRIFRKENWKKISSSMALIIVILTFFGIFGGKYIDFQRFDYSEMSQRSMNSRLIMWDAAVDLIAENPFGYGLETFQVYFPDKISKDFFYWEENLNTYADRVHNELLDVTFSGGILAGLIYLLLVGLIFYKFFKSRDKVYVFSALILIAYFLQNQFSFTDISGAVFVAFVLGGMTYLDVDKQKKVKFSVKKYCPGVVFSVVLVAILFIANVTILKPAKAYSFYTQSQQFREVDATNSLYSLNTAISLTPYYSELWFELLQVNQNSMLRALEHLEQIEGESGNVLAWYGNWYGDNHPEISYEYFEKLMVKNPKNPHWVRAYGDVLYKNGKLEEALEKYQLYLELVPDFWKWKGILDEKTADEQRKYRIFFKNVPDFWETVERVDSLRE